MGKSLLAGMALILATTMAWGQEDEDIPLGPPEVIIKMVDAPAEMKVEITKEKAIELAEKYAGFEKDKGATARLVIYTDPETFAGRAKESSFYQKTPAWLVHLPNASYKEKMSGQNGVEKERELKVPMQVAINAKTGMLMAAIEDSKKEWTVARAPMEAEGPSWFFREPQEAPKLTVKEVLMRFGEHQGKTGQFFLRYADVKSKYNKELESPEFPGWVCSVRGAILKGFSTPIGYKGPPLWASRCDFLLLDRELKLGTQFHKAGSRMEGQRY